MVKMHWILYFILYFYCRGRYTSKCIVTWIMYKIFYSYIVKFSAHGARVEFLFRWVDDKYCWSFGWVFWLKKGRLVQKWYLLTAQSMGYGTQVTVKACRPHVFYVYNMCKKNLHCISFFWFYEQKRLRLYSYWHITRYTCI